MLLFGIVVDKMSWYPSDHYLLLRLLTSDAREKYGPQVGFGDGVVDDAFFGVAASSYDRFSRSNDRKAVGLDPDGYLRVGNSVNDGSEFSPIRALSWSQKVLGSVALGALGLKKPPSRTSHDGRLRV